MSAQGRRIGWEQLPVTVRDAVEQILGAPVVTAVSQPGGFSPGTADRVTTAAGRRAFVKAVGTPLNPRSVQLHRREVEVAGRLLPAAHAPALLGAYDDGDWIALVLEDVEGRHPRTPWDAAELTVVLDALRDLAATPVPAGVDLPTTAAVLADDFAGWERVAADPPPDLDPWVAARLPRLREVTAAAGSALAGDALVHGDLRADNILLGTDGRVRLVDWPEASRGAGWSDALSILVNVQLYGGHDVEALAGRHVAASPADVDSFLAGLVGYFVDAARQPPPPGLPTVRAFQAAQGASTLRWLRRRWDG